MSCLLSTSNSFQTSLIASISLPRTLFLEIVNDDIIVSNIDLKATPLNHVFMQDKVATVNAKVQANKDINIAFGQVCVPISWSEKGVLDIFKPSSIAQLPSLFLDKSSHLKPLQLRVFIQQCHR